MRLKYVLMLGVLSAGALGVGMANAAESDIASLATTQPTTYRGETMPSAVHTVNSRASETIREVLVKPGDHVGKDQVVMQLDDREEAAKLKVISAELKALDVAIKAAESELAFKKVDLARFEIMGEAANWIEKEKAKVEVQQAEMAVEKAKADRDARLEQVEYQKVIVDRMKLRSPANGIVQEVHLREGSLPDAQKPPMTIVQNDPLWVKVNVPTSISQPMHERIKANEQRKKQNLKPLPLPTIKVKYLDFPAESPVAAEVIYFDPVATAGAGRRRCDWRSPTRMCGTPVWWCRFLWNRCPRSRMIRMM